MLAALVVYWVMTSVPLIFRIFLRFFTQRLLESVKMAKKNNGLQLLL